eukprot:5660204-Pleurochrysis_carterae.AAC.3
MRGEERQDTRALCQGHKELSRYLGSFQDVSKGLQRSQQRGAGGSGAPADEVGDQKTRENSFSPQPHVRRSMKPAA